MISGISVLVLLISLQDSEGLDPDPSVFSWCDPVLDCGKLKNSMCYLTPKENTKRCFFIEDVMTSEDKRQLLAMHNSIRDQVAEGALSGWPAAADMRQMSWHDIMAAQATLWATQCNDSSDPCPKHPDFPKPGQASIEIGDTVDYPEVKTLFQEMIRHGKTGPKLFDHWRSEGASTATRNFHQVIYARVDAVGCGLVSFLQQKTIAGKKVAVFTRSLWCNYGIGLEDGETVYTAGEACSACKDKTTCKPQSTYPHLCLGDKDPMYGEFIGFSRSQQLNPATLFTSSSLILAMGWRPLMKL